MNGVNPKQCTERKFKKTGGKQMKNEGITRRKLLGFAALLAASALTVAGCGSSTQTTSGSAKLTPITIGVAVVPPKMSFLGFYVAQAEGFYRKEGLKVNLVSFNNGIQSLQGVAGGHIEFGCTSTSDVLAAADKGGKVENVWSYGVPLDTALVTPTSITSVSQLKGKTIAWAGPGSFAQLNIDAALKSGGVADNAVHYITMNRSEYVPAIVNGQVQGAIFHVDDGLTAELKDPNLHILVEINKVLPTWWYGGLAVSDAYATSHASTVTKLIEALDLADRWMYKHPNQTIAIGVKYTQEPEQAVKGAYQELAKMHEWTVNTGLERTNVLATIKGEYQLKWISHRLTYNQVANAKYAEAALKQIGTANFGY